MKRYDTMTIGHISLDFNIDWLDNQIVEVGGAVIYSSAAAYAGGYKVAAVTKLASADRDRLSEFVIPAEDVYCLPSAVSTSIRNKYFTADKERRSCTCLGQADPFTIADIPEAEVGVYHLAGLIYGDFDGELISALSEKGKVAVDVQALLRHAGGKTARCISKIGRIKEISAVYRLSQNGRGGSGDTYRTADRYLAARMLHDWGRKRSLSRTIPR